MNSGTISLAQQPNQLSASKEAPLNRWLKNNVKKKSISKCIHSTHASLSFAQQRRWFLEKLILNTSLYHMHDAVRIRSCHVG